MKLRVNYILGFLVTTALMFALGPKMINPYDEGIITVGAMRVAAGEWPASHFYSNYGIAQFFLLSSVFKMFGWTMTVGRIYNAVIASFVVMAAMWTLSGLSWQVGRGKASEAFLAASGLTILSVLLITFQPLYVTVPVAALWIVGCRVVVEALAAKTAMAFVPVALVVAASTLFRLENGVLAFGAFGTAILIVTAMEVREGALDLRSAGQRVGGALVLGLGGLLATFAFLHALGVLAPGVDYTLEYNTTNYSSMRGLKFPGIADLMRNPLDGFLYAPPAVIVLALVTWFVKERAGKLLSIPQRRVLVVSIVTTAVACSQMWVRPDLAHALLPLILATILYFTLLLVFLHGHQEKGLRPVLLHGVLALSVLVGVASAHDAITRRGPPVIAAGPSGTVGENGAGWFYEILPETPEAIRFVTSVTGPDDRILSATGRHDKVFINDVAFYFLARRLPGTRWHHYDPGVQTSEKVQLEMIDELKNNHVNLIVRVDAWDQVVEPNKSAESSGVHLLDDFIAQNYQVAWQQGSTTIVMRQP